MVVALGPQSVPAVGDLGGPSLTCGGSRETSEPPLLESERGTPAGPDLGWHRKWGLLLGGGGDGGSFLGGGARMRAEGREPCLSGSARAW